jgi:hypothetical protein
MSALHIVRPAPRPSTALVRKALRLYRSEFASRELRHKNARQWLLKMEQLGGKHLYRGGRVSWGAYQRPGSK